MQLIFTKNIWPCKQSGAVFRLCKMTLKDLLFRAPGAAARRYASAERTPARTLMAAPRGSLCSAGIAGIAGIITRHRCKKARLDEMVTKTKQEAATLKYGYMWVEETTETTMAGRKVKTTTKKIARDPAVGFIQRIFRI
jgi:hypothetical protein